MLNVIKNKVVNNQQTRKDVNKINNNKPLGQ